LGDGTSVDRHAPVQVVNADGSPFGNATAIAGSCAVTANGEVSCWGYNGVGSVGDGSSFTDHLTPVPVQSAAGVHLSNVVALSGDITHCAVKTDGTVWCWGDNEAGQLGNGTHSYTGSPAPVQVSGLTNAVSVAVTDEGACALLAGGTVWCWGANQAGQLGNGSMVAESDVPVQVSGLSDAVALTMVTGDYNQAACVIRGGGSVSCWGDNGDGQLGTGNCSGNQYNAPVAAGSGFTNAVNLALNTGDLYLLRADGTLWAAGWTNGLGNGSTSSSCQGTPVQLSLTP
jgi:alpha-tubulin suppressor-like RCC1 family protein